MIQLDKIQSLLVDPGSDWELKFQNDVLISADGTSSFPVTEGVPWLYSDPAAHIAEWKSRFDYQDAHLGKQIESIKYFQKGREASADAKKRVNRLLQAQTEQRKSMRSLMAPLEVAYSQNPMLHEAIKTKLPHTQNLMSYYSNIFRDWAWGDRENEISAELISSPLAKLTFENMLVLGAGAGRLGVDVHRNLGIKTTVMADINPFLVFCGKKILEGETVRLHEFPVAPLSEKDIAPAQSLKSPYGAIQDAHFVFCDALNPPFKKKAFDLVLTPWFIDIVPMDFQVQVRMVNSLLREGGIWSNFGSLAFSHQDPFKCFSADEIKPLLEEGGFEVQTLTRHEIPYLQSPHSSQSRVESVLCFTAKKVREKSYTAKDYSYLPKWITDERVPIPEIPELQNLIMVNFIFAELLSAITNGATIESLGEAAAPKINLPIDQSKQVIRTLLTRVYEENLYNRNY